MPKKIKVKKSKGAVKNAKDLDIALQHYQAGNFQDAEKECRQILNEEPGHSETLNLLGLIACGSGNPDDAVNCFNRAIHINPDNYYFYNNLGLAHQYKGSLDEAIENFRKTIELNPDFVTAYNNLGISFAKKGMTDDAIHNFKKALSLKPDDAEIHFNLGLTLADRGMVNEAINSYKKALAINPGYTEACDRLGFIFKEKGMIDEAIECYKKVVILNPDNAEAHNNLGNLFLMNNVTDDAIESYKKAMALNPDAALPYYNLGIAFTDKGLISEAIENYERALMIKPDHAKAYYNLGNLLLEKGMIEEAIDNYREALRLNPDNTIVYNNLGTAFVKMGKLDEAIVNYKNALSLKPDYAQAHHNLGMAFLFLKEFVLGWKEYEWRQIADKYQTFSGIRWDGINFKGKTLCIHFEQGVGDEIMFASCLADLLSMEGNCVVECDRRLMPLFRRSFPGVTIRPDKDEEKDEDIPHMYFNIYAGSLPLYFRPDLSSFPQQKSYLIPDNEKVEIWSARFNELGDGLKVGISWRGGNKAYNKLIRSLALEQWSELFSLEGVYFINLQYGDCIEELRDIKEKQGITIHDWDDSDPLKDLDNFAAQISALDLVVSVDNSTVHMAGALGVPVWAMLPFACDWRWMQDFEDTPWYESVRLYRQRTLGDWESVLERVESDLKEYVNTGDMPKVEYRDSYKNNLETD